MVKLEWSSPVRKAGDRLLPLIPNEIYLEILIYFKPVVSESWSLDALAPESSRHTDSRNLALVCRFFSSIMIPWLYEHLVFTRGTRREHSYLPLCRNILGGNETAMLLAEHVKKCSIRSWGSDGDDSTAKWAAKEMISIYFDAMKNMKSLRALTLLNCAITPSMLKKLKDIPNLTNLTIDTCKLANNVQEKHLRNIRTLKLKSFSFHSLTLNDIAGVGQIFPHIDLDSLLELEATHTLFFDEIQLPSHPIPLESLDVDMITNPLHVETLLRHTPFLKKLRLCIPSKSTPNTKLKLLPDALPLLEEISAPLDALQNIIPGRPISSITINNPLGRYYPTMGTAEVELFKQSAGVISYLKISLQFYLALPLADHFPNVQVLFVQIWNYDGPTNIPWPETPVVDMLNYFVNSRPCFPHLRSLELEINRATMFYEFFDLKTQHEWITEILLPKFPLLHRVQFSAYFFWTYSPSENKWVPSTPDASVIAVALHALPTASGFVDYDGCIEAAVRKCEGIRFL
ncbi:hypothetical protein NLJ89_g2368 [Agrocybe chaxingu]|uniref:F-box domain-containing protein n=1 Tax=Agrocybe chaxingu TaxID=84603 RepID=A0A9W8K6Z7_9AGAR|nr:hypothetical protein NLJ89_g2368 [Agrocybe chaxingu]